MGKTTKYIVYTHPSTPKAKKPLKSRRGKLQSVSRLKHKADKVFSLWIRRRDKNRCFTCGKKLTEEEISEGQSQCGHYESRRHTSTRYSEMNCSCQCMRCNVFLKGNYQIYAINLQRKYGMGVLKELRREAQKTVKCDRVFLNKIIEKYQLVDNKHILRHN